MDLIQQLGLQTMSFVALASFGSVAVINFKCKLTPMQNFFLSVVFALAYSFVPAQLGNQIADKVKNALAVAISINGAFQLLSKLLQRVGTA